MKTMDNSFAWATGLLAVAVIGWTCLGPVSQLNGGVVIPPTESGAGYGPALPQPPVPMGRSTPSRALPAAPTSPDAPSGTPTAPTAAAPATPQGPRIPTAGRATGEQAPNATQVQQQGPAQVPVPRDAPRSWSARPPRSVGSSAVTTGSPVYGRYAAEAVKEAAGSPGPSTYGAVRAPTATNAKPFANYQPPDVISPWMYLYRRTGNPAVSNYYQFVKPRMNQAQLNSEVRGLENAARNMNSGLNSLNNRTNQLQGYPGQSKYMNYNDYYPGLER